MEQGARPSQAVAGLDGVWWGGGEPGGGGRVTGIRESALKEPAHLDDCGVLESTP